MVSLIDVRKSAGNKAEPAGRPGLSYMFANNQSAALRFDEIHVLRNLTHELAYASALDAVNI